MLKELLNDHRLYHTEMQQDFLITTKAGGNLWGQYKQAIRELYKRFRGLRETTCDRDKLEIEIEEQLFISNTAEDEFKRRYAAIEHVRKTMQMEEIERVIADTKGEFQRFYSQACVLKKQLGDITEERRKELDKELLLYKIKESAAIDYSMTGGISQRTYENIHCLPRHLRNEIVAEIKDHAKMIAWYFEKDDYYFQNIEKLDLDIESCLLEM